MRSTAKTVDAYIAGLPAERRAVVTGLRSLVRTHLPAGYVEAMTWGMPGYEVPLSRYPDTYNGQPLNFVAFAAQKSNYALYLSGVYGIPEREKALHDGFAAIGRKPNMGKSCIRLQRLEDIPLEAIGRLIETMPVDAFIARHEAAQGAAARKRASAPKQAKSADAAKSTKPRKPAKKSPVAASTTSRQTATGTTVAKKPSVRAAKAAVKRAPAKRAR